MTDAIKPQKQVRLPGRTSTGKPPKPQAPMACELLECRHARIIVIDIVHTYLLTFFPIYVEAWRPI